MQSSNPTVLCLGEALIDSIQREGVEPVEHVGGSILNVACGLARLGRPTRLQSWWADDERGRRIADAVAASGVQIADNSADAEVTTVAHATVDAAGKASYQFDVEWDVPASVKLDDAAHLHVGCFSATLEPGGTKVVDAVRSVAEHGTTSYDLNIRPALMGTPAEVAARVAELVAIADVVKASDEDVDWLYPGVDHRQVLTAWLDAGVGLAVLTRGGDGAWAMTAARDLVSVSPLPVTVADTVGAGDSFMAGLLDGLLDAGLLGSRDAASALRTASPSAIETALTRAIATATITVSHHGAYAPTRDELPT